VGAHELVVETPRHDGVPAAWTDAEAVGVVSACRDRYRTLAARPDIRHVLVFRNHGERAGASLEHPHSQIVATSVLPQTVRRRRETAREHRRRTGDCLLCRLAADEIEARARIVTRDRDFVVFHPFAAARPAETWIVPLAHAPSFGTLEDAAVPGFALVLRDALRRLHAAFDDPDFNYVIHSDPARDDGAAADLHWFVRIVPHLSRTAGFELGSGVYINTEPPEETAERMRSAAV
jgi:UDPglucose--hexose-1-phosphate uridylyltransferase